MRALTAFWITFLLASPRRTSISAQHQQAQTPKPTTAYAVLLRDIRPGFYEFNSVTLGNDSFPDHFTVIGERLFFSAQGEMEEMRDAWVADPELHIIELLNGTDPIKFYQFNNETILIFTRNAGVFIYNTTANETTDIGLGLEPTFDPEGYIFFQHQNCFYIQATNTEAGFTLHCISPYEMDEIYGFVTTFFPIVGVFNPRYFVSFHDLLLFVADDPVNNSSGVFYFSDWKSSNRNSSTYEFIPHPVEVNVTFTEDPVVANGRLFFKQANDTELWVMDTNWTVQLLFQSEYGIPLISLQVMNDRLIFGVERQGTLWSTDGVEPPKALLDPEVYSDYFELNPSVAEFQGNLYIPSLNSMFYTNGTHGGRVATPIEDFGGAFNLVVSTDDRLCFFGTTVNDFSGKALFCIDDGENATLVDVSWPEDIVSLWRIMVAWNGRLVLPVQASQGVEPWAIVFGESASSVSVWSVSIICIAVLLLMTLSFAAL